MQYQGFKVTVKVDGAKRDCEKVLRDTYIPTFADEDTETRLMMALATLAQDLRDAGANEVSYEVKAV